MKAETKDKLFEAWAYCDELDKSTEFTLQYMADTAKISNNTVIGFILTEGDKRKAWYKNNPDWFKKYPDINQQSINNL